MSSIALDLGFLWYSPTLALAAVVALFFVFSKTITWGQAFIFISMYIGSLAILGLIAYNRAKNIYTYLKDNECDILDEASTAITGTGGLCETSGAFLGSMFSSGVSQVISDACTDCGDNAPSELCAAAAAVVNGSQPNICQALKSQ